MKKTTKIIVAVAVAVVLLASVAAVSFFGKGKGETADTTESTTAPTYSGVNVTESQTWFDWDAYVSELNLTSDPSETVTVDPSATGTDVSQDASVPVATIPATSIVYVVVDPNNPGNYIPATQSQGTTVPKTTKKATTAPATTQANEMVDYEYTYNDNSGTVTLNKYIGSDSVVHIPETVNGHEVSSVGSSCFKGKNLTMVYIPKTVKAISARAFYECTKLEVVYFLGNEEVTIGASVFEECTSLRSVYLSSNTTQIGDACFANCTSLKEIAIPEATTKIGANPFVGCSSDLVIKCKAGSVAHQTALKYGIKTPNEK